MATKVLHPGPPPLTEDAVQAAIDVIDFMAAEVRGVDLIDVTPQVRRLWQQHVVAHYPQTGPDGRQFLASGDQMLAAIRANWPRMSEPQRQFFRQQWGQQLSGFLQFLQPVLDASSGGVTPPAYAANGSGYTGAAPSDYIGQVLAAQQAAEQEAYRTRGPLAAQQVAGENQAIINQVLSNMSAMNYKTSMAIANNMKY